MSRFARLAVVAAFVLAYLSQPLALDACSVSCEAALAARALAVAAPCHHTTSCASQISQPAPSGSTAATLVLAPPLFVIGMAPPASSVIPSRASTVLAASSPPIRQLRV